MGCGASSIVKMETTAEGAEVDRLLAEAQAEEENLFKILLLGAGESGKSTVVKQIKMIYKNGVSKKEKEEYIGAIRRNAIDVMQTILEAMDTLSIDVSKEELSEAATRVKEIAADATLTPDLAQNIADLWADAGVQACYERRAEYWLLDAAPYYLDEVLRLGAADYADPTEEDMIMTRVRTTGIVITEFDDGRSRYNIVDVGGQRSERRKWIHCFDDVKAIIFLVGLSGYNQVLFEDNTQNRMTESLELFQDVVRNPIFADTPIYVFLNKKDLFEILIKDNSLKKCFPEYDGPDGEMQPALEFIEGKYKTVMEQHCPGKEVSLFVIAARVRMDMKMAFGEVKDMVRNFHQNKKKKKRN